VLKKVIERWRLSREIEPGHRFQARYGRHRLRRQRGETSKYGRLLNLVGGPALIVAGFAFIPTPGPSYIIIVIGMWMLAGEFQPLARFFDRLDVRLRKLAGWVKKRWNTWPAPAKVWVALACVVGLGYGMYCLLSGG
jgi:Putative transmembrane protein (PGPGW)